MVLVANRKRRETMMNKQGGNLKSNTNPAKTDGQQSQRSRPPLPVLPPSASRSDAPICELEPVSTFSQSKAIVLSVSLAAVIAIGMFSWISATSTSVAESQDHDLPTAQTLVSQDQQLDFSPVVNIAEELEEEATVLPAEPVTQKVRQLVARSANSWPHFAIDTSEQQVEKNDTLGNLSALNSLAPQTAGTKRPHIKANEPLANETANVETPNTAQAIEKATSHWPHFDVDERLKNRVANAKKPRNPKSAQQANKGFVADMFALVAANRKEFLTRKLTERNSEKSYTKDSTCGTKIPWEASLTDAITKASETRKLVFLIQVSGNFANEGFT